MKNTLIKYCLIPILAVSAYSCNQDLDWTPSILGPLVNTNAKVKDLSDLENKQLSFYLPSIDLGFPSGVSVNVPPLNIPRLGPDAMIISDYFIDVEIDTAVMNTSISNAFPIPIGVGTEVTIRSSPTDTTESSVIFRYNITQQIAPGGTFTNQSLLRDNVIPSTVYFTLENFQSPGGSNVVFSSTSAEFTIDISFLSIKKIRIGTNNSLTVSEMMNMNFESNENDSTLQNAVIHVFFDNQLPVNVGMQMYFMDEFETGIIDSMFNGMQTVNASVTDPFTGSLITEQESSFDIPIDVQTLDIWETSSVVRAKFRVNTIGLPGTYVTASDELGFKMTVTGDIDLKINFD